MNSEFQVLRIEDLPSAKASIRQALQPWCGALPEDTGAQIVLKPNCNSNLNALTGNTTDLRVISAVLEFLDDHGYRNVVIADGPSSGFARASVSVMRRLRIDRLAAHYGATMVDLNECRENVSVALGGGISVDIPKFLKDAGCIINIPKIKTHCEAGMSCCLKNLIGICVGQPNKAKMHYSLARHIIALNEVIKPALHVVDGLIAMEGNGPSAGTPVQFGTVVIGEDPFTLDYICARLAHFPVEQVRTLKSALELGIISPQRRKFLDAVDLDGAGRELKPPHVNALSALLINPRWRKYVIKLRSTSLMNAICSVGAVKSVLLRSGVSQERVCVEDADLAIVLNESSCSKCNKCADYCPLGRPLEQITDNADQQCLGCLYCYSVCPDSAISLKGHPGFFAAQIERYDKVIRQIA